MTPLDLGAWGGVFGNALALAYALALGALVAYGLVALALSAARLACPPRPTPRVSVPRAPSWPRLVVQLPVYDEPPALVGRALDAALSLRYPGPVEIQLLDDSSPSAQRANAALCAVRGRSVRHLRRPDRAGFKAGALAAGLAATDAELAAVFDVDFRPDPDLVAHLVSVLLADPGLAFVQAPWAHPDADRTALGRAQAALLDVHFAVEQGGRDRAGWPVAFNGSGGVWRREAIEEAGGWRADTLAEDLDLALRAQAGGWRARVLEGVTVDADLPPTLAAWRRQQARWVKGGTEVGRLRLGVVWRSGLGLAAKLSATAQVGASLSAPALLALVVLHPLLALARAAGWGPGHAFGAALNGGYLALAGAVVALAVALGPRRQLRRIPYALAAPLAFVVPASYAVVEALRGRRTPFVRTPKAAGLPAPAAGAADALLALYSAGGALALALVGAWEAVPAQTAFAVGLAATVAGLRRDPSRSDGEPVSAPAPLAA